MWFTHRINRRERTLRKGTAPRSRKIVVASRRCVSVRAIERTIRFPLNNNDNNNNNETMKIQWQRYNVEKNSEYLTR